jgi:hypothetical protein
VEISETIAVLGAGGTMGFAMARNVAGIVVTMVLPRVREN